MMSTTICGSILKASSRLPSLCSLLIPRASVSQLPGDGNTTNQDDSTTNNSAKDQQTATYRDVNSALVYKYNSKPTRYGYSQSYFDGGPIPRLEQPIKSLPQYKPKDSWNRARALYGQNDYIDILGSGDIKPYETHTGPKWLRGFYGNEFARTLRRLKFNGTRLAALHPKLHHDLNKRLRYLYKQKNFYRKRGVIPKYI